MKLIFVSLLFASILTGGCAKDSGVFLAQESRSLFADTVCHFETSKLGEDITNSERYRIYQQGATGFVPLSGIRDDIEQQATHYCNNNGKKIKMLQIINSPTSLGCPPKAELIFTCIQKESTEFFEDKTYIKLSNLKKLLESGTITKEEFEQQKTKILNP
ncbi:MAG: SHOCT domain-containing protein [Thiobacillus sp.]|nr:SHOCT domain-containing protein [Thiobacillus sp.]